MPAALTLRTVRATRYVLPLREGGSMPGLVEADDDGLYVVKFRGAGQGPKALVAEVVAGELARAAGLRVPEIVLMDVDPVIAAAEPDPEIQELVQGSGGLNAALDFLPGALPFTPAAPAGVSAHVAAAVVWFDALVANVDRTPRNPNMLVWHGNLWLIDHGAALYRHHAAAWPEGAAAAPFPQIADHALLPFADPIDRVDAALAGRLTPEAVGAAVAAVPDLWLGRDPPAERDAYVTYLQERLAAPRAFAAEAEEARRGRA
ncbi:aminotransferase class I and II [Baekduia soli]|uniref:Aminotransferase class I and II n=1 Tax=Baekduia soli TaxID=496014 RepID=A0A5B8U8Y4_9ACTN|nr:HipA family kinase [Baekduia soli]QEC49465.1 aminotransferase class I and II [Baekduia soli]